MKERNRGQHVLLPRNHGISLIELLLVAAAIGGIAVTFSQLMSNQFKAQRHIELSADKAAIQRTISGAIDCKSTLAGVNLNSAVDCKAPFALKRKDGTILVADGTGTKTVFGPWTVRATCIPIGNPGAGISVQVARPKTPSVSLTDTMAANFNKDQLNQSTLSWNHPKAELFPAGAGPCQSYFDAGNVCPSGGTLVNRQSDGRKICRYAGPLIHGSVTGVTTGPATWNTLNSIDPVTGNPVTMHHYGNQVSCPDANWMALTGGGSCDRASMGCNSSGGFVTTSLATRNATSGIWSWHFECAVFYLAGCQVASIPGSISVDCIER